METSDLLVNLVFGLTVALAGGLIAARLGQSAILGYLAGGLAIGPYTPGPVGDIATVEAMANIGIILLLFAIGVQLSFRDLVRVGKVALVGGTLQVVLTIGLGYLAGLALGWSPIQALFLGAVVSNSSSTVISKVLGERGEVGSRHGQVALAWSSVQDFGTVILVVLLTAVAGSGDGLASDLVIAVGKAALFLVLLIPLGLVVFPWLFARVAALRQREVFVLAVGVVAFGTAYAASFFGLSLALGAFVAGVAVGSDLSHQVLGAVLPLRDIFAGLFFVSVGMLVDPVFVVQNIPLVLAVLILIVAVKGLLSTAITALAGFPVRTAVLTGAALAQSAEFSFLLAHLGTDLEAVSDAAFSVMLAGAVGSIVVAPALHRVAFPVAAWLDARLPLPALNKLPEVSAGGEALRNHTVICGHGRVGRLVAAALRRRGLGFVVIDQDRREVEDLRAEGVPAYLGNAENPILLDRVHLDRARVLVVTVPDPVAARLIVDYARQVNPRLDIVIRTHSEEERAFLERRGASEAVVGDLELALELTRHTLHRYGVSSLEVQAILRGLRGTQGGEG